MKNKNRSILIKSAWKASSDERFSEAALIESALNLADEKLRPKLRQALPSVWSRLDEAGTIEQWLAATGLDGDAIDAINAAIGAGLPTPGKKAGLHSYSLRPRDFPALVFLALVAARLATPYVSGGPHQGIRAQYWYVPELVIVIARSLPPKLSMMDSEHIFRFIMQAPEALHDNGEPIGWIGLPLVGEPLADYLTQGVVELQDFEDDEK
jgi:hypothetical protein